MRYLSVNAPGELRLLSEPDRSIGFMVESIVPVAQVKGQQGNHFWVRVRLTDPVQSWWRPGMSGLALFEQLQASGIALAWPVIFLTGHADVPTAVDSVKRGAFDFCEKPFSDNALVDRVEQALLLSQERLMARTQQDFLQSRLGELTDRERDVMRLVVEGLPNKLIADQLDISVRTVEVHRSRVFDKMEVKSAVELANLMRTLT